MHKLAKALLIYETLSGDEIRDLIKNIKPTRSFKDEDEDDGKASSALGSLGLNRNQQFKNMRKYYTRACNFFYGDVSKRLIKMDSLPLCGDNFISFNQLELIIREKKIFFKNY